MALTDDLRRMLVEMDGEGWLTELPLVHLMPALTAWLAAHVDRWRLLEVEAEGDVLLLGVVSLGVAAFPQRPSRSATAA